MLDSKALQVLDQKAFDQFFIDLNATDVDSTRYVCVDESAAAYLNFLFHVSFQKLLSLSRATEQITQNKFNSAPWAWATRPTASPDHLAGQWPCCKRSGRLSY